ncbi:MAG: NAD(+)/NADH kinase [Chloroflexi bacterium]|nr:NAD(+)/NADH kinase [Chloroflexota bacterium]
MSEVTRVGVLAHPLRPQTFPVAELIAASLRARGVGTVVFTEWQDIEVASLIDTFGLVIAIGGDGAMLRAARVCAPFGVPVLGINMGQLGFLTEVREPDQWPEYIDRVLARDYWIEQRMMLAAVVLRNGAVIAVAEALNDVVVSGDVVGRMIQLETHIDGHWTTTYNADGLVIATATGSTAYALACGGPILPPELKNILVVPAAPHMSMDRPIVLSEGAKVEVRPSSSNRSGIAVTADGVYVADLQPGDRVTVQASQHVSQFVRTRARNYFYRSLLDRFEPRVRHRQADDEADS